MDYEKLGHDIGSLVTEKQKAYGDSFSKAGRVMKELYPDGISLEQIDDALVVVRILDKLFRIATDKDALGESPYRDISGYGLLGYGRSLKEKEGINTNKVGASLNYIHGMFCDHQWVYSSSDSLGYIFVCQKCGEYKQVPQLFTGTVTSMGDK